MTSEDMLVCAVCGSVWKSPRARATHEGWAHPEWTAPAELARRRTIFKNAAWKRSMGPSYNWMSHANDTAQKYGQEPLPIRTPLPVGPCTYCGGEADGWDHVEPFARGGLHVVENITPACLPCNQRKNRWGVHVFALPLSVDLVCGWCWKPVVRKSSQLRDARWMACSRTCLGNLARNPLPFGRPWHVRGHKTLEYLRAAEAVA